MTTSDLLTQGASTAWVWATGRPDRYAAVGLSYGVTREEADWAATGAATVPSGEVATVTWDSLKPRTTYAWVVIARSSGGGVTSSQPSVFVTRGRTDRGS